MSDITPAQVADALTGGDDVNEVLNRWVDVNAIPGSSTVRITVTPINDAGDPDTENAQHFRAVVVPSERTPIVFDRAAFEQRVNERFDAAVRKLAQYSPAFMPATIAALRQQILSLDVDIAEAAQEQKGGEK